MGRKQRNKQSDPPALVDDTKKRKHDQNNERKRKSKKPKKENTNDTKLKGQRVNGKLVVPEKTRVAGKLAAKPVAAAPKAPTVEDDEVDYSGTDSDDEKENAARTKSLDDDLLNTEKAALFDSDSDADEENDDPLQDDEDDVMLTDEEDEANGGLFSDSEDEELLTAANMESMSRKIDEEEAEDQELAEQELHDAGMAAPQVLPTSADEVPAGENEDLTIVASRLQEIVRVLADYKTLGEAGKSRIDYMNQFQKDVITYFGYSEYLAERFIDFFSPAEALAFFDANETPRPIVIRVNTLKTTKRDLSKALIDRGVNLGEVGKWTKCALQIFESSVPIGATPEYMAGQYILQAASSLVPVLALKPESGDRVLDMAAAPGGKTSFLAQEMKNEGIIIANEVSRRRQKSLVANLVRMGCKNVVTVCMDGRVFGHHRSALDRFDKVLLDAPCSGTGVIHKDPSVKTNRTEKDLKIVSQLQRDLLLSAIDALKVGGVVVYSTCSVMIDENEMVVDYALRNRNIKLEEIDVSVGEQGLTSYKEKRLHPTMTLTKRFYPHVHNMDGFFVARIRKLGPQRAPTPAMVRRGEAEGENEPEASTTTGTGDVEVAEGEGEESVFQDAEDAKIIAEGRRHQLRKQGKRVPPKPQDTTTTNGNTEQTPNSEDNTKTQDARSSDVKKEQPLQSAKVLSKPAFKKTNVKKPKVVDYSKPQPV